MKTEIIIAILTLAVLLSIIISVYRKARKEAERVFDWEYDNMNYFIKYCDINTDNEVTIISELNRMSNMTGADKEKLQVLNSEFRRKFSASLSDIIADHESN